MSFVNKKASSCTTTLFLHSKCFLFLRPFFLENFLKKSATLQPVLAPPTDALAHHSAPHLSGNAGRPRPLTLYLFLSYCKKQSFCFFLFARGVAPTSQKKCCRTFQRFRLFALDLSKKPFYNSEYGNNEYFKGGI